MIKKMFFLIYLISSSFLFSKTEQTNINIQNDNTAVIWWVGYNNKKAFRKNKKYLSNIFSDKKGAFRVPKNNIFSIKTKTNNFIKDLEYKLVDAISKISKKNNPTLIIFLSSHGGQGFIGQQKNNKIISYENIIKTINKYAYSQYVKDIKIEYYIDTCYSGSIIEIIKENLPKVEFSKELNSGYLSFDTEDSNQYKYKVEVFTSSRNDNVSYGSEFLSFIKEINNIKNADSSGVFRYNDKTLYYYLQTRCDILSYFMYWRSYTPDQILSLLNKLEWNSLDNNDACSILYQEYDFTVKKMIFCHSNNIVEKEYLSELMSQQICALLQYEDWNQELWREIPKLIKESDNNINKEISNSLINKEKWTHNVWKVIPKLIENDNMDIRNNIARALYNQKSWTPKVVRKIKKSNYSEIKVLIRLIPYKIDVVEYLKFP